MYGWYRRMALVLCALVLIVGVTGCKKREQRTMRMHAEQRQGEVQEQRPGEMVVE
jgi:uncharacterized lipoprotein YehR (DUF1307 family)